MTERERLFVDAYMGEAKGNAAKAATIAGYSEKGSRQRGSELLTKRNIQDAIDAKRLTLEKASIADAAERRELLTAHARNVKSPVPAIKAIDVLNRMDGLYIEKHDHSGNLTVEHSGAAERLAGTLASIATRAARRISGGPER
jgi:phage terminase small subunit